jgi:hypothetical protein
MESELSSRQKGAISENRVAEIITLASKGNISCFTPITDDDGLDLIISPKGAFKPLFLQIKSRFKLQKNGRFIQNVGFNTFSPHKSFYVLFLLFNEKTLEVDAIWLVPSLDFREKAYHKKEGKTYKSFYRIAANPNTSSQDIWGEYLTDKTKLVDRIYAAINEVYK